MAETGWLIVIRSGGQNVSGRRIVLGEKDFLVGRSASGVSPDLTFPDLLVSRRHCMFIKTAEGWLLRDLGSKHGTAVNGQKLVQDADYLLRDGDQIGLAMGAVLMRFTTHDPALENTMDISRLSAEEAHGWALPFLLDEDSHECRIGEKVVSLSAKEWAFLKLLYDEVEQLVLYDRIRVTVWPERQTEPGVVPDVGIDELNVLIYRLRRKLGPVGRYIRTVRGCGCSLKRS